MRERTMKTLLNLRQEPIGIAFLETIPDDLPRIDRRAAASCSYWALAAAGQRFYTLPEDHFGCPIGALVHGLTLPPPVKEELQSTVQTMLALKYLCPDEPSTLPRVGRSFRAIIYSPLDAMADRADVGVVIGKAKTLMLLTEAAYQIGLPADTVMGRPACGMIAHVLSTQRAVTNLGCIGNRVYTGIGDDEFYFAFPGAKLLELIETLPVIQQANRELEHHHEVRLRAASVNG